ncbi:hypothetical protein SADUNF_Sadunf16G0165800 [Salix dunnii]|uniref:Uncharacterized protein n=1 Tax=Salix dunnii TaxID=1413687 RepID=A0A835MH65_9ROSI|nr:hypothetical protein SADUNF_Sadunf16G0165800 [Salix dunnii]
MLRCFVRIKKQVTFYELINQLGISLFPYQELLRSRSSWPVIRLKLKSLMVRLKLDEEPQRCWDSLVQLQAGTGEFILLLLDGEPEVGHAAEVHGKVQ